MTTASEINAFENFRFKIGDIVAHVADGSHGARLMITERVLVETSGGLHRRYAVSGSEIAGIASEIELRLVSVSM